MGFVTLDHKFKTSVLDDHKFSCFRGVLTEAINITHISLGDSDDSPDAKVSSGGPKSFQPNLQQKRKKNSKNIFKDYYVKIPAQLESSSCKFSCEVAMPLHEACNAVQNNLTYSGKQCRYTKLVTQYRTI